VLYRPTFPPNPPIVLSPELLAALRELAEAEDLPLPTLITVLINEALQCRLRRH
jgi:hypothetical protein